MDDPTGPSTAADPSASAPAAPPSPTERLAQMSPAERTEWQNTGTLPGSVPDATGDAGAGDDSVETSDAVGALSSSTTDPAASEAGRTLAKRKETVGDRINKATREKYLAEGRAQAAEERAAALERQLRGEPTRDAAAPAPVPAPAAPLQDAQGPLVEPNEEDFDTYKEYVRAAARYEVRLADAVREQHQAQTQIAQQQSAAVSTFTQRIEAFRAQQPDYDQVIAAQTEVYPTPVLRDAVLHSEVGPQLAYYLNSHVEDYRRLVSLPPGLALIALGKLEARIEAGQAPAAAVPSANHVTHAPAPPITLGSRPVVPADDVDSAVARRDPGAYRRAMNARELAARSR